MKYGYKEVRKIDADKIRGLCVKRNWFNNGTNEEYDVLLQYGFSGREITTDELVEMAELILEHTLMDYAYEITTIMWELNEICYTYFEEA